MEEASNVHFCGVCWKAFSKPLHWQDWGAHKKKLLWRLQLWRCSSLQHNSAGTCSQRRLNSRTRDRLVSSHVDLRWYGRDRRTIKGTHNQEAVHLAPSRTLPAASHEPAITLPSRGGPQKLDRAALTGVEKNPGTVERQPTARIAYYAPRAPFPPPSPHLQAASVRPQRWHLSPLPQRMLRARTNSRCPPRPQ
ncbi:hypothetical protein P154DRAFT_282060 [Amniculicola lignicola CBS 123094]|uniref:Uncharacterized protein n=1 Tax=Amniculicola lignicola CBS 123094 TaxID=1392246 RepID=A0A6A5WB30_9PLEO|nr:hypothetical protein P154DRAFT_282060 [Amniculicola lignicola CBS 123094]